MPSQLWSPSFSSLSLPHTDTRQKPPLVSRSLWPPRYSSRAMNHAAPDHASITATYPPTATMGTPSTAPGRLKRVLGARRKKSALGSLTDWEQTSQGALSSDDLSTTSSNSSHNSGLSGSDYRGVRWPGSRSAAAVAGGRLAQTLAQTTHLVFGRKRGPTPSPSTVDLHAPSPEMQAGPEIATETPRRRADRASTMLPSPSIDGALRYMREDEPRGSADLQGEREEGDLPQPTADEEEDSLSRRRESVAATIRPVSGASIATITPGFHLDISAEIPPSLSSHSLSSTSMNSLTPSSEDDDDIIARETYFDAETDTAEDELVSTHAGDVPASAPSQRRGTSYLANNKASPPSLSSEQKRRSVSLDHLPQLLPWVASPPEPSALMAQNELGSAYAQSSGTASLAGSVSSLPFAQAQPTQARLPTKPALSTPSHSPSKSVSSHSPSKSSPAGIQLRDRLAALSLASQALLNPSSSANSRKPVSSSPSPPLNPALHAAAQAAVPARRTPPPSSFLAPSQPPLQRRPTVSMTQSIQQGLAPAAAAASGIAHGIGKKVERFLAGSSSTQTAFYPATSAHGSKGKPAQRRTPGGSGSWGTGSGMSSDDASSTGHSSVDNTFTPQLGNCVRNRLTTSSQGIVFGCRLAKCVEETRIGATGRVRDRISPRPRSPGGPAERVEDRSLPALIVRCVQHLNRWGIDEEGLFRISGRALHIAKLRAEFDKGADYDLAECSPSQLDPHAVSSVFKAYLRELPDPILTRSFLPLFDDVLAESALPSQSVQKQDFFGVKDNTRAIPQMRKPPSLSNLAPPSSSNLLHKLSTLISRLPIENRDLLFTVTDLLKSTAKNSQVTKMPLSNLLLLFCPSLGVSPQLLRLLCEAEGIWAGPLPAPPVETPSDVLDIHAEAEDEDRAPDDTDSDSSRTRSLVDQADVNSRPRQRTGGRPKRVPVPTYIADQTSSTTEAATVSEQEPVSSSTTPLVQDEPRASSVYHKALPAQPVPTGAELQHVRSTSPHRQDPAHERSAARQAIAKRNAMHPSLQSIFTNKHASTLSSELRVVDDTSPTSTEPTWITPVASVQASSMLHPRRRSPMRPVDLNSFGSDVSAAAVDDYAHEDVVNAGALPCWTPSDAVTADSIALQGFTKDAENVRQPWAPLQVKRFSRPLTPASGSDTDSDSQVRISKLPPAVQAALVSRDVASEDSTDVEGVVSELHCSEELLAAAGPPSLSTSPSSDEVFLPTPVALTHRESLVLAKSSSDSPHLSASDQDSPLTPPPRLDLDFSSTDDDFGGWASAVLGTTNSSS